MGSTRAPAGRWEQQRQRWRGWVVAGTVALLAGPVAAQVEAEAQATDPLSLPMEELVHTDVVSAERFARQVTDAASAVSVLTAEDIRRYGWRTLGEVLEHMRGISLTTGVNFVYMGSRGLGGLKTMSGRVLLLIDGVPANDNLLAQTSMGYDGLIDPAWIARIEYAPGSGSAMYGNNAFMGVINVITLRGRDLAGLETALGAGNHGNRYARIAWGDRPAAGGEWLAAVAVHRNDGAPGNDYDLYSEPLLQTGEDARLLFKADLGGWRLGLMGVTYTQKMGEADDTGASWSERNTSGLGLLSLARDDTLGAWRATQRLSLGRFQLRSALSTSAPEPGEAWALWGSDGAWWLLDSQWSYHGLPGHQLVLGGRLRNDNVQKFWFGSSDQALWFQTRTASLSVEDQIELTPQWRATLGLRAERQTAQPLTWSPRAALVYTPDANWTLKLSHGRSTRQFSVYETLSQWLADGERSHLPGEHASTTELMGEYRSGGLRLLGSLYRYRLANPYTLEYTPTRLTVRGLELEGEWLWQGWQLRGSQTWQLPSSRRDEPIYDAPRSISKLMLSAPLGSERWRASLVLRHTGPYQSKYLVTGADTPLIYDVPGRTVADLTLTTLRLDARWNLTLALRNLFNAQNLDMSLGEVRPHQGRSFWLEVSAAWR